MLRMIEILDDKVEEWNIPNITHSTYKDLCMHYIMNFPSLSYQDKNKVEIRLYNKNKLLLTFSLTKH